MTTPITASDLTFSSVADARAHPREFLEHLYRAAVNRALPLENTARYLPAPPTPESGGRTIVIGAGKAGGSMAHAVEALWPAESPLEGLVVTRYLHTPPRPAGVRPRIETKFEPWAISRTVARRTGPVSGSSRAGQADSRKAIQRA